MLESARESELKLVEKNAGGLVDGRRNALTGEPVARRILAAKLRPRYTP